MNGLLPCMTAFQNEPRNHIACSGSPPPPICIEKGCSITLPKKRTAINKYKHAAKNHHKIFILGLIFTTSNTSYLLNLLSLYWTYSLANEIPPSLQKKPLHTAPISNCTIWLPGCSGACTCNGTVTFWLRRRSFCSPSADPVMSTHDPRTER